MSDEATFRGVLLDIEGTTSSISYVFDVMFPYVREHLASYLTGHIADEACLDACLQMASDAGASPVESFFGATPSSPEGHSAIIAHVNDLMDRDVKSTGLKRLQGLIWENGFRSGALSAHVYPDVRPALQRWRDTGRRMWIYSSGSVHAQKLFFGHSIEGDLLPFFEGHWDTKVGGKKEPSSYQAIASEIQHTSGISVGDVLFVSDVPAELDAAATAGMKTRLAIRPGNHAVDDSCPHRSIQSFDEIE
ncbi:MAG: acireductone synthase [Planctomycetota bacterium]